MAEQNTTNHVNVTKGWLIGIIVAVIIFLGAAFVFGAAVGRFHANRGFDVKTIGPAGRGMRFSENRVSGLSSNQDVVRGVVTSVNGSNFTVAGNGATNDVTTNSSTQWHGASSVKANDSVIVSGTLSNNTFTAADIVVNP